MCSCWMIWANIEGEKAEDKWDKVGSCEVMNAILKSLNFSSKSQQGIFNKGEA